MVGAVLMKHYKDKDGNVFGFREGDSVAPGLVEISIEEARKLGEENFKKFQTALSYVEKRRMEYPPIGDQLDALWKGGAEAEAMKAKIQEIKAKYPK
jgi:hypothetical protein